MKALLIPFLFLGFFAFGECVYCTDLNEALESPAKVEYLDLRAQGLTEIPEKLNDFTSLKFLDLSENNLTELNISSWKLPFLEELNLNFNPGVNFIDIEGIGEALPSLSVLRLQRCSIFAVSPELGKLDNLTFLDLSSNGIAGLPDEIGDLKQLKQLYLADNKLANGVWATELWQITELDVSGNNQLNLESLGYALLFKDNLNTLKITPEIKSGTIPKIFSKVPCKELVISATQFGVANRSLIGNKEIKHLVFEGGKIPDPDRFYNWLNQFHDLKQIEFRNMNIPAKFSEITSAEVILMDACRLASSSEIEDVKRNVTLEMINMGSLSTVKPETVKEGSPLSASISEGMLNNTLPAIVKPSSMKQIIDSRKQQKIEMDNSSYFIPSGAFLGNNGRVYVGPVQIEVKEYFDPFTNALTGVPMVYRGENGENEVFSSSGMIDFRASDMDGNALSPNPNKQIQVELRDLQPAENSNLYVYDTTMNNWREIGQPETFGNIDLRQRILDSLNALPDELFYTPNIIKPGFGLNYKKSRRDPYILTFYRFSDGQVVDLDEKFKSKITAKHVDQKWIATGRKSWRIDTEMTEEMKALFKSMRKSQAVSKSFKKKRLRRNGYIIPPVVTDLKLVPNFEDDNYTLSFKFKGEEVQLPVTSEIQGSIQTVQRKEKSRFLAYNRKLKEADRERISVERNSKQLIEEASAMARERQASLLMAPGYAEQLKIESERLRFGLSEFGLVNCDYFMRNRPNFYVKSTQEAEDADGNKYTVPNDVRQIFVRDNAYVSSPSFHIPQYKRRVNYLFFAINASQIGLIKSWESVSDGYSKPHIVVLNIEGKSPEEVRELIVGAE